VRRVGVRNACRVGNHAGHDLPRGDAGEQDDDEQECDRQQHDSECEGVRSVQILSSYPVMISLVISAVFPSIALTPQYFSCDRLTAFSILLRSSWSPVKM